MMAIINTSANNNSSSSSSTKLCSSGSNQNNCVLIASSSSSASTTSSMEDENVICPLCMENLDIDDRSFYPCTCGYQICRFCWHRIRSESDDQNGLCPACRKQYSENPATFKPLSSEDIQKLKLQKRQKDQQKKQKSESGKRHLADLRVVQKNLVFVVGISPRIADPDVLKKNEFFGKFGKIHKVVVNPCLQGTTASAYITYIKSDDALRAIQSVNNIPFDGKTIKVSLGTTKYCSHFMRNQTCPKTECMYLHHYGDPDASFTKEDMQAGKHQEYEKKLLDEFNTHQNNNNNNESSNGGGGGSGEHQRSASGTFNGVGGAKDSSGGKVGGKQTQQRIANGSSIQQGVSYSTKLLVNNTSQPPQSSTSSSPPQNTLSQTQHPKTQPDRTSHQNSHQPPHHNHESTPPPCSSSSSSSTSSSSCLADNLAATATNLLESTILSEEDDNGDEEDVDEEDEEEEEEIYHEAISKHDSLVLPQHQHQQQSVQHNNIQNEVVVDPFGEEFSSDNTLDFDPFLETQKAFEEIINQQVSGTTDSQAEQSSLLRRFIKPRDDVIAERASNSTSDYLLGFHHNSAQQQHAHVPTPHHGPPSTPPSQHAHPQQQHNTYAPQTTQSSLLLDFFSNYAYKHVQHTPSTPSNIPPPPGFSQAQQQQTAPPPQQTLPQSNQSSSVLLEKLNRTLLGNGGSPSNAHWGVGDLDEQRLVSNTAADWMSLDPAIIFSKTSSERIAEQRSNRNFIESNAALHGLFGERGSAPGLQLHHHFSERNGGGGALFQGQVGGFGANAHQLIRPTPTSTTSPPTPPSQYVYSNGILPQQQPQQPYYTAQQQQTQQRPTPHNYYPQQQQQQQPQLQQSRYYGTQQPQSSAGVVSGQQTQQSMVTPPPPGFSGLHSNMHKPQTQQQQYNQQVYALQGQLPPHNGSATNSAGFFPF